MEKEIEGLLLELKYNEGRKAINDHYREYFCPCEIPAVTREHIKVMGRGIKKKIEELINELKEKGYDYTGTF